LLSGLPLQPDTGQKSPRVDWSKTGQATSRSNYQGNISQFTVSFTTTISQIINRHCLSTIVATIQYVENDWEDDLTCIQTRDRFKMDR